LIARNTAYYGGACNFYVNANAILSNVTIANNSAQSYGGIASYNSNPNLINCILWGNSGQSVFASPELNNVTYSNIEGGYNGEGNFDENPEFCNPAIGNYELSSISSSLFNGQDNSYVGFSQDPGCNEPYSNYSLSFNGNSDYVVLSSSDNLEFANNEITFTAWVKIPSNHIGNEYSTIIGGRSGFGFTLWAGGNFDNGAIRLNICCENPSEVSGNFDLRDDQWHFISVVYDGSRYKVYIDGNLDVMSDEFSTDLTAYDGNGDIKIGIVNHENADEFFHGQLDELGFWNKA
jgi:hypothetical protein